MRIDNPVEEEGDECKKVKDLVPKDESDKYRMWAAISFAFTLIVIGIPLWWKTTEVYRASLPYERIEGLQPLTNVQMIINVYVYTQDPRRTNVVIRDLNSYFSSLRMFRVNLQHLEISLETLTSLEPFSFEKIERHVEINPKTPGNLLLVQIPFLPNNRTILVSNNRVIYFTQEAKSNTLGLLINTWMLQEEDLINKIISIVEPQLISDHFSDHEEEKINYRNRLRASPNYDVIFSVVNSDPDRVNLIWDIKSAIKDYVQPLLDQIKRVGVHTAKSQWLYMIDLGVSPSKTPAGDYVLHFAQIPHIITPIEKKLGSGISKNPYIHLVLFCTSCDLSPLKFLSPKREKSSGMISSQWGAIQLLNPDRSHHCSSNRTNNILIPESHNVMAVFLSQLHTLLGIGQQKPPAFGIDVMQKKGPLLRLWELDLLYRMRAVEQITSATLTLQSLAKLLGEISNIVINEEVAECVKIALDCIEEAVTKLKVGDLDNALSLSSQAFTRAETAFSNPSLLALLYFPDDQKYAVYIPLFLPIMIPVLMSLKNIYKWVFGISAVKKPN